MSVLFILVGASVLVAVGFLIAFITSVRNGQYDDQYTPSVRILFDESETYSIPQKAENKPEGEANPQTPKTTNN